MENQVQSKKASMPTIRRLPNYLNVIKDLRKQGHKVISGTVIAQELELEPIQVRKDLAVTGIIGKPRVGYVVNDLEEAIIRFLGWDKTYKTILAGTGNLGRALLGYKELKLHGMDLTAAFDIDETLIGTTLFGVTIYDMSALPEIVAEQGATLGIITVPASEAQKTADLMIEAGITSIWNFSQTKLKTPRGITVQRDDLSSGFAVLSTAGN